MGFYFWVLHHRGEVKAEGIQAAGHTTIKAKEMDVYTPCSALFLYYHTLRERFCPLPVCVFPHQLTQSRQFSTDVPTGRPDLDNPHCNSAKILGRVTTAIKINHHRFPPK